MTKNKKTNQPDLAEMILQDRKLRVKICRESHYTFFHVYFPHYVKYRTADFQKRIFKITEDETVKRASVVAFRNSGKSTIATLSLPIWAIMGKLEKKYVVILSQTQNQAQQHFKNIKDELEGNELLRADLGPFQEEQGEWGAYTLLIPKFKARITIASSDQRIRGLRHKNHRPDLIVADDIEDLSSVKNRDSRNKTYDWLKGEVFPLGDQNTKIVIVGNLLHEDSTMMRLKKEIAEGTLTGTYAEFPLLDESGNILWPGKFPDQASIEKLKKETGSDFSWHREYLLEIISNQERIIQREWIKYYDALRDPADKSFRYTAIGIDLAISQKNTADYTAMIMAHVFAGNEKLEVYILPVIINQRLTSLQTIDKAVSISAHLRDSGHTVRLFVEDVGYQGVLVEQLKHKGFSAEGMKVYGDKSARLAVVATLVESGKVFFPRKGAEVLIDQLVNFGIEKHDDLADAFAILLAGIQKRANVGCGVLIAGEPRFRYPWEL